MPKITSEAIRLKLARPLTLTIHLSPYINGLAPETRDYVAGLNAEAERLGQGVKYLALANRINAIGTTEAIEAAAARDDTLGGETLRIGLRAGFIPATFSKAGKTGWETVMKRGNSEHRKYLRKRDKTKAGIAERKAFEKLARDKADSKRKVEAAEALMPRDALIPRSGVSRGGVPIASINGGRKVETSE